MTNKLAAFFQLDANQTTLSTEIMAGISTFFAMSYIIFVNPAILSQTGMPLPRGLSGNALRFWYRHPLHRPLRQCPLCPGTRDGLECLLHLYRGDGTWLYLAGSFGHGLHLRLSQYCHYGD